jgi:hypothetical protein
MEMYSQFYFCRYRVDYTMQRLVIVTCSTFIVIRSFLQKYTGLFHQSQVMLKRSCEPIRLATAFRVRVTNFIPLNKCESFFS